MKMTRKAFVDMIKQKQLGKKTNQVKKADVNDSKEQLVKALKNKSKK